jgi:hypothetical protein
VAAVAEAEECHVQSRCRCRDGAIGGTGKQYPTLNESPSGGASKCGKENWSR